MFGIIGVTLGLLVKALFLGIIFMLITGGLSSIPARISLLLNKLYRKLRTVYYGVMSDIHPDDEELFDQHRRSKLHANLWGMQLYINLLTRKYGSFEVCHKCHLPHRPELNRCPYCMHEYAGKIIDPSVEIVYKVLKGQNDFIKPEFTVNENTTRAEEAAHELTIIKPKHLDRIRMVYRMGDRSATLI